MQLNMLPTALLALLPVVSAGYSYGSGSSYGSGGSTSAPATSGDSTSSTPAGVHIVNVGKNGLTMEPNDLTVPAGETIEFHFFTGSHSVAQSAFATPCTPLVNGSTIGFFSGSFPVQSGESANVFTVTSTGQPMWYYCATGKHCQNGMVGVVNKPANGQRTIDQYKAAAAKAAANLTPASVSGGSIGTAAGSSTGTTGGTGSTPSTSSGPTATPNAAAGTTSMFGLTLAVAGLVGAFMA